MVARVGTCQTVDRVLSAVRIRFAPVKVDGDQVVQSGLVHSQRDALWAVAGQRTLLRYG